MKTIECKNSGVSFMIDDDDFDRCSKITWTDVNNYICGRTVSGGPKVTLQRFILKLYTTGVSALVVDHIDNNPLNNQKSNLRIVRPQINSLRKRVEKPYRWVSNDKRRNKFYARVRLHNGRRVAVGPYSDTPIEPFKAALAFMRKSYPELNDEWDKVEATTSLA